MFRSFHFGSAVLLSLTLFSGCRFTLDRTLLPGEIRGQLVAVDVQGNRTPVTDGTVFVVGSVLNVHVDARGRFVLKGLVPGTYSLRIARPDAQSGQLTTELRLSNVNIGTAGGGIDSVDLGTIEVAALGSIEGAVTLHDQPVTGAHIIVQDLNEQQATADGRFAFASVPPGTHQLYVVDTSGQLLKPGTGMLTVTVQPRQPAMVNIALEGLTPAVTGTVSGVAHTSEADQSGITVTLTGGSQTTSVGTTDVQGAYSKAGVPAGVYTLQATKDGLTSVVLTNVVVDGDTKVPDLLLAPASSATDCGPTPDDPTTTGCDPNASCSPGASGRVCTCNAGWTGNGATCTPAAHVQNATVTLSATTATINGGEQTLTVQLDAIDATGSPIMVNGPTPLTSPLTLTVTPASGLTPSQVTITDLSQMVTLTYDGTSVGPFTVDVTGPAAHTPALFAPKYKLADVTVSIPPDIVHIDHTPVQIPLTITAKDAFGKTVAGPGPLPIDSPLSFTATPPDAVQFSVSSITDLTTPVTATYDGYGSGTILIFPMGSGIVEAPAVLVPHPRLQSISLSVDLSKPLADSLSHPLNLTFSAIDVFGQPLTGTKIPLDAPIYLTASSPAVQIPDSAITDLATPVTATFQGSATTPIQVSATNGPNTPSVTITPIPQYLLVLLDAGLDFLDTADGSKVAHVDLPAGSHQLSIDPALQSAYASNPVQSTFTQIDFSGFPKVGEVYASFSGAMAAGVTPSSHQAFVAEGGGVDVVNLSQPGSYYLLSFPSGTSATNTTFDAMTTPTQVSSCVYWNEYDAGKIGLFETTGSGLATDTPLGKMEALVEDPAGQNLYMADGTNKLLRLWSINSNCSIMAKTSVGFPQQIVGTPQTPMVISAEGKTVYATFDDGNVLAFDTAGQTFTPLPSVQGGVLRRASLTSDGTTLYVFDAANNNIVQYQLGPNTVIGAQWPATNVQWLATVP